MQSKKDPNPGKKDIKTDEILERLEKERGAGQLIKLVGRFLGNSDHEDCFRLYLSEDLNRYLEFSKEGTVDAERFPSGRIVVWLQAGTKVTETVTRDVPEDFLKGFIQQQNAARQAADALRGTGRVMMAMASPGGCCGGTGLANCEAQRPTVSDHTCSHSNCPTSEYYCE